VLAQRKPVTTSAHRDAEPGGDPDKFGEPLANDFTPVLSSLPDTSEEEAFKKDK
jgi:hypothetical protein